MYLPGPPWLHTSLSQSKRGRSILQKQCSLLKLSVTLLPVTEASRQCNYWALKTSTTRFARLPHNCPNHDVVTREAKLRQFYLFFILILKLLFAGPRYIVASLHGLGNIVAFIS